VQQTSVMLVEDEEHLAFALEFNLAEEGYRVDVANDIQSARELLEKHPVDLIILDVMLPDGSGFDYCTELRAQGVLTPILMLTAKGASSDIVTGLNAGADDYMTKPFHLGELLGRVAAMLRRRRWTQEVPAANDVLIHFGDNCVDFEAHEVRARGERIDLTELEMRLLRYFTDREGEVVTREQLLTDVWGVSANTATRTVDNFIVRLRRAFELDPASPRHFLTLRGIGYRFIAAPETDA